MSDFPLLTVAEAAELLHVSTDTITRQIKAGLIPAKRIRASIRISREWVESFAKELAPVLLSRHQVSVKLGISVASVRTLQIKGLLPTVKIAKAQRIPSAAVAEYLKMNSVTFLRSRSLTHPIMPNGSKGNSIG